MKIRFETGGLAEEATRTQRQSWRALVVALAIFLLWLAPSVRSDYERQVSGETVPVHRHVTVGVLGYLDVEAARAAGGDPWSVDLGITGSALLFTALLTLPALALCVRLRE